MRVRRWMMTGVLVAAFAVVLGAGAVAGQSQYFVQVEVDGEQRRLPLEYPGADPELFGSGGAVFARGLGESTETYEARVREALEQVRDGGASVQNDGVLYHYGTDFQASLCFLFNSAWSTANQNGERLPIDYIYAKSRVYAGKVLVDTKEDAHSHSSHAGAHARGTNCGSAPEGLGTHKFVYPGHEIINRETRDTNPW